MFPDVPVEYMSIIDRAHNKTRVSSAGGLVEVCISSPLLQLLGFGFTSLQLIIALCELQFLNCETQDCRSVFNPKWLLQMFLLQVLLLCQPC